MVQWAAPVAFCSVKPSLAVRVERIGGQAVEMKYSFTDAAFRDAALVHRFTSQINTPMKQSRIFRVLAFSLLGIVSMFFAARVVLAASNLDFDIHNKTGEDIINVYCTGHSLTNWGDDILGEKLLANGSDHEVRFTESSDYSSYDLKVTYSDNTSAIWYDLDLNKISDITLSVNRDGTTTATTELR